MKGVSLLTLVVLLAFHCPAFGGQEKTGDPSLPWKVLSPGLSFLRWEVRSSEAPANTIAIFRVDPLLWSFRVFFNRDPKTIKDWQQITGASVVWNGGFYQENFDPAGRILVNGASFGPFKNRHMKGMFLAEPKRGVQHLPRATLIDLKNSSEETISSYDQGIQSFPILLDPRGQVRVNPSNFRAARTVLAQDRQGLIYVLITEKPLFTLFDLGNYLKGLPFGFQMVLNLDGGLRSQAWARVGEFSYHFTGQGEDRNASVLFFPGPIKIPSVIGIFPRGGH
jgi:uncharacterized protein YigE (DUF2233 family)